YTELLTELSRLGIAYVHIEATADEELLVALRRVWPGTLVMNPVLPMGPKQTGREDADHWLGLGADLISFGRGFIANPDLVERLRTSLPVAPVDESTYYQGGDAGYLTYPAYQHTA
ncbi:alkene reductase, partial [Streptomyces sp. SID5926]|nr:alkene reductase [Streptomyces sp. SID5926]